MKVLQVASSLKDWGGIERYVAFLTEGLIGRGIDTAVVCPWNSPLSEKTPSRQVHFLNRAQYSIRTLVAFKRIATRESPEIAHIHFSPDFIMPARALRARSRAKLVMTRHLVLSWSASKVRRYTGLFDHIIPVSEAVQRKLAESGVPDGMMTVAKAGVPAPPVQSRSAPGREELVIGFFGRLVAEKGVDVLLRSVSSLSKVRIEVFGDGPAQPQLRELARTLGLGDRVTFHGFVSDVWPAMAEVDAVCVPSVWEEAFPYSVLEAMAIGKPVIASIAGGLPEVVIDRVTGRLFEKGNPDELAKALDELQNHREFLDPWGRRAQEIHAQDYTVERMAQRIEDVYKKVLDRSPTHGTHREAGSLMS